MTGSGRQLGKRRAWGSWHRNHDCGQQWYGSHTAVITTTFHLPSQEEDGYASVPQHGLAVHIAKRGDSLRQASPSSQSLVISFPHQLRLLRRCALLRHDIELYSCRSVANHWERRGQN